MPHAEVNGLRVAYHVHGDEGPWLTVVHGGLVGAVSWQRQASRLSAFCQVLTYDVRGYGDSDAGDESFAFTDLAGDLIGLWDTLGVERSFVLGFSAGGCVAQHMAAAAPDRVEGLVLESTAACLEPNAAAEFADRADAVARDGVGADVGEHVRRAFSARFRAEQPEVVSEYAAEIQRADAVTLARTFAALAAFDGRPALASVACPVLALAGGEDQGMHGGYAREIGRLAERSRVVVVPHLGHTMHIEAPSMFCHVVSDFVTSGGEVMDVIRERESAAS